MPKLIIDNREIEVPQGTKVIEAAEMLGIMIPRFCYHPALGSVGACRVCAVKVIEGPMPTGIQMSCMLDARDGMVISTTDEEAVDFRRHIIEFLMLNHPHDCPVCDEGGHCLLQDMTVSGGHGLRRFPGNKRTHVDQDLGPLVQHEMNRCIQCYRCTRYYREYSGYSDLGVRGIGSRVYFGRFEDGTLESPFSGNLIDVCPTGVYTDKPARFKGRRWDFERTPSVCIHCSLGCHITVSTRYREVVRHEARENEKINGHFICDRGRFGFYYASREDRPRKGRVDGQTCEVQAAVEAASDRLNAIEKKYGADAAACIGSCRSSLETLSATKTLCGIRGWQSPAFFTQKKEAQTVRSAIAAFDADLSVSLKEIELADLIIVVGADLVNEAPMTAIAVRQAVRSGVKVAVMDPRPVELPFKFQHLILTPEEIARQLAECAAGEKEIPAIAELIQQSRKPVIICGTDIVTPQTPALAAAWAEQLKSQNKSAGIFTILPSANAFSAGLLAESDASVEDVISNIEAGKIKALMVVEADPFDRYPNRKQLEKALQKLDLLVVADYLNSTSARIAHVMIPATTVYESGGTFINNEGRLQPAHRSFLGGTPVMQTGGGDHPPRKFNKKIPGSGPQPAWLVLGGLGNPQENIGDMRTAHPALSEMPEALPDGGWRVPLKNKSAAADLKIPENADIPEDELGVVPVERTFGTETLSSLSPCLADIEKSPFAFMHRSEAEKLGLHHNERIAIETEQGKIFIRLKTSENMAGGILVLPRDKRIGWGILSSLTLKKDQIRKLS